MKPVAASDEAQLPIALEHLYAAVGGLVDPRKELVAGSIVAQPSMYESLVDEIEPSRGNGSGRFIGKSRPPLWVDAFDLRTDIDNTVKQWQPGKGSTPRRLHSLSSRCWRPQDTQRIREHTRDLQGWAMSIRSVLNPEHVKEIAAPCPACGRRWVYKQHGGENIRAAALQLIAHQGCSCQACKTHWPPERYLFLCRLLGFDLPAGVIT
jgi:hypothetical protein